MLHWSTCMAAYVGQPPDPAVVGDELARRAGPSGSTPTEPWVATWLAHQRRDAYWRQGSACERYADITCPVFAIGGWSDGYRDMVLRMLEHVRAPVRGLIGPWGHIEPGVRLARAGDRLPAGARALLRRRAQGRGERLLRRAGAGQLPAGADRAGPAVRGAARALGRRPVLAVAARRGAAARARGARALAARAAAHRARRPASGAATAARPTAAATSGRRTARRCAGTRRRSSERLELLGHAAAELELTRRPAGRARRRAAVRGRARRHVDADRPRRAQPHPSRRARPRRPARAGRAGARARADAVDVLRRARRPRAAARALADLLAVDLAVARAGDADRRRARRSSCRCAGRRRSTPSCSRSARPRRRPGWRRSTSAVGTVGPDRPPRPRDGRGRTSSSRGSTTATR